MQIVLTLLNQWRFCYSSPSLPSVNNQENEQASWCTKYLLNNIGINIHGTMVSKKKRTQLIGGRKKQPKVNIYKKVTEKIEASFRQIIFNVIVSRFSIRSILLKVKEMLESRSCYISAAIGPHTKKLVSNVNSLWLRLLF